MKNIKYIIGSFIVIFASTINVSAANKLNNLDVFINIDSNGTSHVKEIWTMVTNKDTEIYKEQYDLGNMQITNFKVKDEKREYTYNSTWDINKSFSEKKYTYGINVVNRGIELCWGISEYGNKTYTITYDIENSIFNTEDAQVFYLKLINDLDFPPKSFSITIEGPEYYQDTLDVWGYGYKGYAYVQNGKIYLSNEDNTPLSKGNYAVALIKFEPNTFNTTNTYSQYPTFNSVLEKSNEGTFEYDYNVEPWYVTLFSIITTLISILIPILIVIFAIKASQKYKFGPQGKTIKMKEINNFRDIPCNKDAFRAFFIAQAYSLNKKNTDFLGSIFLKWFSEGKIEIITEEKKKLFKTRKETNIRLKENTEFSNETEAKMYKYLMEASEDGLLEENELSSWSKNNYNKLYKWFDTAEKEGRDLYINEGFVTKKGSKFLIDDSLKEEAIKLAGLKKYLINFSNMKTKEAIEVKLWKEYLIYAQLFGIADKVAKQFKDLYPEVVTEMNEVGFDYTTFVYINSFSNKMIASASTARSAAQSYNSGGGGFSVGGGGGGSFGGGGGGSR